MRAQLIVLAICVGLIVVNGSDKGNVARLFPLVIVAINAIVCLLFWIVRLNPLRNGLFGKQAAFVGLLAIGIGHVGLFTLVIALCALNLKPSLFQGFHLRFDPLFYILCAWAILELVHHHVYKLIYGKYDSLEYLIQSGHWRNIEAPLGGAIGVQVRKMGLRRHLNNADQKYIMPKAQ